MSATHDPKARLLSRKEVADRLARDESYVDRARRATDPKSNPPPMPGWKRLGTDARPHYFLPESALIEWINKLPDA